MNKLKNGHLFSLFLLIIFNVCLLNVNTPGAQERPDLSDLISALGNSDSDYSIYLNAAIDIKIHYGEAAVPSLINALKDPKATLRARAAETLGMLAKAGVPMKDAIPDLIILLNDKDPAAQSEAAKALGEIGPAAVQAFPYLVKVLTDENRLFRSDALKSLYKIDAARMLPLTEALLAHPDSIMVRTAISGLVKAGEPAVPALTGIIKDGGTKIETTVVVALGDIGPAAAKAVPHLIKAMDRHIKKYRMGSVFSLCLISTLGDIGPDAEEAVPILIECLKNTKHSVREQAAESLGNIGPCAEEAVPYLMEALKDQSYRVKGRAIEALKAIGLKKEAVPGLINVLFTCDVDFVQNLASSALGQIGAPAIPGLEEILKNENSNIRLKAIKAFGYMRDFAADVIPLLTDALLNDREPKVRAEAAESLENTGFVSGSMLSALIQALKSDRESAVRLSILDALSKIDIDNREIIPVLLETLEKDTNAGIRSKIILMLAEMGPEAEGAIPALLKIQKSPQARLQKAALYALEKIKSGE